MELDDHGKRVWKHKTNKRLFLEQSYRWKDRLTLIDETEGRQVIDTYQASAYDYGAWTPMTKEEFDSVKSKYLEIYQEKNMSAASDNGGLFTDSQLSYVNGVSDKDLRAHLLHQVRLRDLLRDERDELEKAYDELVLKFKRNYSNGLQLDDWDKLKKGDVIILNTDSGDCKRGDKFKFMWCDGITFVIKPFEMDGIGLEDANQIYEDRACMLMFHTKEQWG